MITHENLHDIDMTTGEGQLLMTAVAILTSIEHKHITNKEWGSHLNPNKAVKQIADLCNKIYYEEEWKAEKQRIKRDNKINQILKGEI